MRKHFPGYYRPTNAQLDQLWRKATFTFDANVLLGLYRYSAPTREELLQALGRSGGRIWLPNQAALEYQRNRAMEIGKQRATFSKAREAFLNAREPLAPHTLFSSKQAAKVSDLFAKLEAELDAAEKDYPEASRDPLRDSLDRLFEDKVGAPYEGPELETREKEAERRLGDNVPPGNKDAGKKGKRRFGDVLLWLQILEFAKERASPVILVTDEQKDDWWIHACEQPVAPRAELVEEFRRVTGQDFYMYNSLDFIAHARGVFGPISEEAIQEVRERKEAEEKRLAQREALRGMESSFADYVKARRLISDEVAPFLGQAEGLAAVERALRELSAPLLRQEEGLDAARRAIQDKLAPLYEQAGEFDKVLQDAVRDKLAPLHEQAEKFDKVLRAVQDLAPSLKARKPDADD